MKIKLIEVTGLVSFINNLTNELRQKKLPIRTAFKLNQLFNETNNHFEFFRKKFNEMLDEYGEFDSNGKRVLIDGGNGQKIKPECIDECQKEMKELEELLVDIPDGIKFNIDELDTLEVNFTEMQLLMPFITE